MELFIEKKGKRIKVKFTGLVKDLLVKFDINPESVIVVRNKEVITEDERLEDSDSVDILSVVSGG